MASLSNIVCSVLSPSSYTAEDCSPRLSHQGPLVSEPMHDLSLWEAGGEGNNKGEERHQMRLANNGRRGN